MRKNLVISFVTVLIISTIAYYNLYSPEITFDKEIYQIRIGENTRVVGYRANKGDATVPFFYYYFFLSNTQSPNEQPPFMIASSDNIKVMLQEEGKIKIEMQGEIIHFENEAWTKANDKLQSLKIDIDARHQ